MAVAKHIEKTMDLAPYWARYDSISKASGTTFETFRPVIPWQRKCLRDIRTRYDYSEGVHSVLLSGSVGSAKSILLAHIAVTHCLNHENAVCGLFRMALPDLKATIFEEILEHLKSDNLIEGRDYWVRRETAGITFKNGSRIRSASFTDLKYTKVRSWKLSLAIFEEMTEFEGKHKQAFEEVRNRVGRLPHMHGKENLIIGATNPSDPRHWLYKYFMVDGADKSYRRHVFYSITFDNPFLPKWYITNIIRDYDTKMLLRMAFGQWIEIKSDVVYYNYDPKRNFRNETTYRPRLDLPINLSWDFNIGVGKPMSVCALQRDEKGVYHVFDEWVIDGMRTLDSCEAIAESGILEVPTSFIINGDASGYSRDTRQKMTDYDIIMKYLENYVTKDGRKLNIKKLVPASNPPVRDRHNKLNALFHNAMGEIYLYVYDLAKTVDEGLRLARLKEGSGIVENDSDRWQHITTALGYAIIVMEAEAANEIEINKARERMRRY